MTKSSELKRISIETYNEWVNANRPRQGPVFEQRCKAKAGYRNCIRLNQSIEKEKVSNSLHDALIAKSPNRFLKMWNSKFGKAKHSPSNIDGLLENQNITNHFASHFETSCSVNSKAKNVLLSESFLKRWSSYFGDLNPSNVMINVEILDTIITDMQLGKVAGIDNLSAVHLRYGLPVVLK